MKQSVFDIGNGTLCKKIEGGGRKWGDERRRQVWKEGKERKEELREKRQGGKM